MTNKIKRLLLDNQETLKRRGLIVLGVAAGIGLTGVASALINRPAPARFIVIETDEDQVEDPDSELIEP